MDILSQIVIFLGAAFVAVPLSKRLGLGSVLGYLVAGVILGPYGLGIFSEVEQILDVANLGIVLLLFVIGLELQPDRLWTMRGAVFGMGGAQAVATTLLLTPLIVAVGVGLELAIIIALTLVASSTPLALQVLSERKEMTSQHGRLTFAVVLFQDLMAIPLFAIIPLLGASGLTSTGPTDNIGLNAAITIGTLAGFLLLGRIVLRQVMRVVAKMRQQEMFTTAALFTVAISAWLMDAVGVSPALGAFLAGVLLADSEYRHELEANIEPFKGLLLSLLFVAVGMSVNLGLLAERPAQIVALVVLLVVVKAIILYALGRYCKLGRRQSLTLAIILSQGGEFAFALLITAFRADLMDRLTLDTVSLVVSLSMVTTPLLVMVMDRFMAVRAMRNASDPEYETPPEADDGIIIAGFGRVGQITARILRARGVGFVALEPRLDQVELARKFGAVVYFGDPARLDLLRAAGADKAKLFVLTIEDVEHSVKIAETVTKNFPSLRIYARARNRNHVHQLMDLGVTVIERETLLSSLELASKVLRGTGLTKQEAERITQRFRRHDENQLYLAHASYKDEKKLIERSKRDTEELAHLLRDDDKLAKRSGAASTDAQVSDDT